MVSAGVIRVATGPHGHPDGAGTPGDAYSIPVCSLASSDIIV